MGRNPLEPLDAARLVCSLQLWQAETDPAVAAFLESLPQVVLTAAAELGATGMVPVPFGWGGAVVRMRCAGRDLAVKVPHHPGRVAAEVAGATTLAGAGLGPAVVAQAEQWYAVEWLPGGTVGELLVRVELDVGHLVRTVEALWAIPAEGLDDLDAQWRQVVEVPARRTAFLRGLGLDPYRTASRITELSEQLLAAGRRGFSHGDLHPGNIVVGPAGWALIDPRPGQGPQEADLAFLLASAACGRPDRRLMEGVCAATGLDPGMVDAWALVLAGEFATCLCDAFPDRRQEIAGFAENLRRL